MSAADILRAARLLLADPARWTRGVLARNAAGSVVAANSPEACSFCAAGAIIAVSDDGSARWRAAELLADAVRARGFAGVKIFNDSTDHATVLRMFDLAIARAEGSS